MIEGEPRRGPHRRLACTGQGRRTAV